MSNYESGADALNSLNSEGEGGGNDAEFAKFNAGTSYTVKVLGTADLIKFYSYGIFKQINSFVAKNPSKKTDKGFPIDNLTSWDMAMKYHADKSEKFGDDDSQEAYKYRAKERYAMGFLDVDTGEPIIIDVSKPQALEINGTITEEKDKLDQLTFKLSKTGAGTATKVSLKKYVDVAMVDKLIAAKIDVDDNLTDVQRKNFDESPEAFDMTLFEGILYEMDDDEMLEKLVQAGFDVSLIGLDAPKPEEGGEQASDEGVEPEFEF